MCTLACDELVVLIFYRICYIKLKLLLLAIGVKSDDGQETSIAINPGTHIIIKQNTQGFFVAQSADEAKRSVQKLTRI